MKRITLAMMIAAAAGVAGAASLARAQDPTPPTPPTPPARPAPATRPAPAARAPVAPRGRLLDPIDIDDLRDQMLEATRPLRDLDLTDMIDSRAITAAAREASRAAMIDSREAAAAAREATRAASMIDTREIAAAAREATRASMIDTREIAAAARDAARATMDMDFSGFRSFAPMAALAPLPPMPPLDPMMFRDGVLGGVSGGVLGGVPRGMSDGFRVALPASFWAQGDPADSAYRAAHDALNRGDYGRAARMFSDIRQKYPKSDYLNDSMYYEAYARYKIGTTDELHTAAKLLEPMATKIMNSSNTSSASSPSGTTLVTLSYGNSRYAFRGRGARDGEVAALYNRINGALAMRGDRDAADKVSKAAAQGICDNEDIQVKVEALSALSQMDPATAMPLLRKVLDRKDACSSELRRRAVFMLGRRADNESAQLLIATAKTDTNYSVRSEAINALPRLPGDVGLKALEEMLRTEQDERIQRSIIRALASSDNQAARSGVRALIERNDVATNLRIEAINSFNSDRATTEDAAYLRNYYGKTSDDRLKEAIISSVGRMGGPDNDRWILSIAQNQNEPSQLRSMAISRMIRSNIPIADLNKLYDSADSYNVRSQIISVLANRKESEATDKLIDIIKNGTVIQLRTQAINALQRKNDPRSVQLLTDLLDGKKP
jgi:HEAT repeat protein/TolA-binding protein